MSGPVVRRPQRLGWGRRQWQRGCTLLAWGVYAVLWLPLVTWLAWLLGLHAAWQRLYVQQSAVDPFVLVALPVIALVCGLLLIGWAEYSRRRHADADQRRRRPDVGPDRLREGLGAPAHVAQTLRQQRHVTVHLDAHARPREARVHPP